MKNKNENEKKLTMETKCKMRLNFGYTISIKDIQEQFDIQSLKTGLKLELSSKPKIDKNLTVLKQIVVDHCNKIALNTINPDNDPQEFLKFLNILNNELKKENLETFLKTFYAKIFDEPEQDLKFKDETNQILINITSKSDCCDVEKISALIYSAKNSHILLPSDIEIDDFYIRNEEQEIAIYGELCFEDELFKSINFCKLINHF